MTRLEPDGADRTALDTDSFSHAVISVFPALLFGVLIVTFLAVGQSTTWSFILALAAVTG